MTSTIGRLTWWVAGVALVVMGAVLVVATPAEPVATFSVLTYEPMTEGDALSIDYGGGLFVSWWQVAGATVAGLGVLLLVGRAAWVLGRRTPVG